MAAQLRPFVVDVPGPDLEDLRDRLARARWPAGLPKGWARGTDPETLRALVDHWHDRFDWREAERALNAHTHHRARIDGIDLHIVSASGRGPSPLPLVLTHGWPSTFAEYLPLLGPLSDPASHGGDPADAFDVVVPSLPGFGFSDGPPGAGMIRRAPELWHRLMTEVLGFERYGAHGADIGAFVTNRLGFEHPERLVGIHVLALAEPWTGPGAAPLDPEEIRWVEERPRVHESAQAYAHLQRTTPTTLGYALHDSPVGLAAWILEKWEAWSEGDVLAGVGADHLLTTISLFWLTGTATSAAHAYADLGLATAGVLPPSEIDPRAPVGADGRPLPAGRRIEVPAGLLRTHGYDPPRAWAERAYGDLRHWERASRGGHFLAAEAPEVLVEDLRAFFRPLRPMS